MSSKSKKERDGGMAIGGGVLLGLGAGFFFLQNGYALYFVGSILVGLGVGLIIASIIEKK
jgi:prolipoprotein diacylglyceryltransferase